MACYCSCLSSLCDPLNWNKLIKNHLLVGNADQAVMTYIKMQELGFQGNNYTFPILLKAAGSLYSSSVGLALHGQTIKTGFCIHFFVQTSLLNMYGSLQCPHDALKVFDRMPVKDVVAWNSMVDTYASCGQMDDATMLFDSMPLKNRETFNIMVSGYARTGRIASARSIFDTISVPDIVSWNSIILAYAQAGDMEKACELFKQAPIKNVITWNTMMTGYLGRKFYSEVIDLFHEMKAQKFEPDHLTVAAVVSASTHLGSLETGTRLHIYAKENDLETSPHVTTALIEMYAKCGSIRNSLEVFYKSQIKDIYCWNAILSGLAVHGYGHAALKLFHRMRNGTTSPDDITFIALLNACSHSGLVQEGCQLFKSMEEDFGLSPKLEHFGCLVDLLGRAGLLDQAIQLVEAMPFEPGEYILGALLSACVTHRNLETGERAMNLISAGAGDLTDGEFMMFANLYASCGLWDEANKWRELMNNTGILKTAGCSSVEINGKFHRFLAGEVDMKLNLKLP